MYSGKGKSVFGGIAIGKVCLYRRQLAQVDDARVEDTAAELERFYAAKGTAAAQLKALYEKTLAQVGENEAMILDVQLMMLDDGDYLDFITNAITVDSVNAPWAVSQAGKHFSDFFAGMDDAYMKERAGDVRDVSDRVVAILCGGGAGGLDLAIPAVIVAEDLTPSETVQLDKDMVLGFVTKKGSGNSHTAILARTMSIPSLVQADIALGKNLDGKTIIVDGYAGTYILDPDEATLLTMRGRQREDTTRKQAMDSLRGLETVTPAGQKIHLYANIGSVSDLEFVIKHDAEGIGLFRSEFLYIGKDDYPTEEEQFAAYRKVASGMGGKAVIIRTLDIGADKKANYFGIEPEENPALGYRAIRICLDRVDLFKTQLRAILRASAFGKVSVMFPMIISVDEVRRSRAIAQQAQEELDSEGIATGDVEYGIMIETPAAAIISGELAKECDFFSVGTNDLTQYTLALDRQNPKLDGYGDPHHPALLELLRMVAKNAHEQGIWAGICGELGADLALTDTFLEMGYDELSVSPAMVLELRKKIRESAVR